MRKGAYAVCLLAIFIFCLFKIGDQPPTPPLVCSIFGLGCPDIWVEGYVKEGWENVRDKLMENIAAGYELGGSLCVFHQGEKVVDLLFGHADRSFEETYSNDTIQIVYSSTKVIESLVMAMLVDRGLLSYEEKIAKYWPEFAQGGKEDVTVGDLMSHAGGVAGGQPEKMTPEHFRTDRARTSDELGSILAATPLDETCFRQKGTQGYHAFTRGLYASQLVRRVDPKKRILDDFAKDEIMTPMGLDFRIGLPDELSGRNGVVQETTGWKAFFGLLPRFMLPKWVTNPFYSDRFLADNEIETFEAFGKEGTTPYKAVNCLSIPLGLNEMGTHPDWRHMESPSSHGYTNARTLARIAQAMAHEGTDPLTGTKLLSKETWEKANKRLSSMYDNVMLLPMVYTQGGFGDIFEQAPGECLGWAGAGGSLIQWCPDHDLSIGYAMNFYSPHMLDWRGREYMKEAFDIANQ